MKHFIHRTEVSVVRKDLQELGIDCDEEWEEFFLVLKKVTGYRKYREDEDYRDELTLVYFGDSLSFTINTPFNEFDDIMKSFYKQ